MKTVAIKSLPMPGTAAILSLLAEIRDELRGLRADLVASRRPVQISMGDAELLRAIAATSQGQTFRVADLLLRAEIVDQRAEDQRLRSAIVTALGEVNGKRLGRLLRRIEGTDVDSLCVARVGRARDGVSWRVATFEPAKGAKVVASSR